MEEPSSSGKARFLFQVHTEFVLISRIVEIGLHLKEGSEASLLDPEHLSGR